MTRLTCSVCGTPRPTGNHHHARCKSCAAKARVRANPNGRFRCLPDEWKARARLLAQRGYDHKEITQHLFDEGREVNVETVREWVQPAADRGGLT